MLYSVRNILFALLLVFAKDMAGKEFNTWTLGFRLPVISLQARDFIVPRLGIEFGLKKSHEYKAAFEFGVPLKSSIENVRAKGVFLATQAMIKLNNQGLRETFLGLRSSYLHAEMNDYLRYDESISTFRFSQYKQTEFQKSRFKLGVLFIEREQIWKHVSAEIQLELGYTNNRIMVDEDVDQVYFNNGWLANTKSHEGPYLNLGINLFYTLF